MKYYKIDYISIFNNKEEVLGHANGEYVPNAEEYFEKISNDEIVFDAPIFDYFHLQSYGPKDEWDWKLQDVHGGLGVYPRGNHWYISTPAKKLFEKFIISQQHHFYRTKLLYKKEKLDYWIFQNIINFEKSNINFEQSIFKIEGTNEIIKNEIIDYNSFSNLRGRIRREHKRKIILEKLVLFKDFDFLFNMISGDRIISERMKKAIQNANLKGFIFSDPNYNIELIN